VPVALEYVDKAAETYRANAPHTTVLERDVRDVSGRELLEIAGLSVGELDVLDGSPPCQSFSTAGVRDEHWGAVHQYSGRYKQRTDDLFDQFCRLIDEIHPKVVVAENVKGLVSGVARGYFKEIFAKLGSAGPGYEVKAQLIKGRELGVPQKRERVIFIAVRKDLAREPVFPTPYHNTYVTLREAIHDLPAPDPSEYAWLNEGTRTRMAWDYTDVVRDPEGCFRHAYQRLFDKDARYMWFKLAPNKVCPTVAAKIPSLFRWDIPRTLSIPEIKRVSTFPDDLTLHTKICRDHPTGYMPHHHIKTEIIVDGLHPTLVVNTLGHVKESR
jgi:DNA (cytosine-5)-methyltransferase 1